MIMWQCLLRLTINSSLKNNQIRKKVEKLLKIEFDSKPVYGDDDKYIKTKIKNLCRQNDYKFSKQKNAKRKSFWKNVNMNQKE